MKYMQVSDTAYSIVKYQSSETQNLNANKMQILIAQQFTSERI